MTTDNSAQATVHPSFTKVPTEYLRICKQANAAPYLGGVHSISLGHYYGKRLYVCTSLAPRPMTMVFGLGTRLRVRMLTTFKNGILHNGQQLASGANSSID